MNNKVKTNEELEQEKAQKLKDLEQYASPSSSADRAVQQITDLEAAYGQQSQNLAQSRKQEKEDAYVLYQRMQKYMPQYLKSLGMTGLGVSETYASQAMGDYQNNLSSIEQAYRQEQQALDSEKNAAISGIKENYATEKENERTSIWENVLGYNYKELLNAMDKEKTENGEVSQETHDKTMAWIEANKDKLPNTVYQQLMAQMQGYQPKVKEETEQESQGSGNESVDEATKELLDIYGDYKNIPRNTKITKEITVEGKPQKVTLTWYRTGDKYGWMYVVDSKYHVIFVN